MYIRINPCRLSQRRKQSSQLLPGRKPFKGFSTTPGMVGLCPVQDQLASDLLGQRGLLPHKITSFLAIRYGLKH